VAPKASTDNPDALALNPGIACNAQLSTDIVVHGHSFSPIPIDIPKHPRLALPSLTLLGTHKLDGSATSIKDILYSGDPDHLQNLSLLTWQSQDQMTFTINQAVELVAGGKKTQVEAAIYDVKVKNPNTSETQMEHGALAIVDKPTFATATPSILCVAQEDRGIKLTGTTFLQIDGKNAALTVENETSPFPVTDLTDCTDIKISKIQAKYCSGGGLTFPKGSLKANYDGLTVVNPQTAACKTEETIKLRVVPPPVLTKVDPPLACVTMEDRKFTIIGTDFLTIDGKKPSVTIAGKPFAVDTAEKCEALPTDGPDAHQVQKCTELKITVAKGALDVGKPEIIVTNPDPAGCQLSNKVALTIVPPPTLADILPSLECVAEGERKVDLIGKDILTVDGVVPGVSFDGKAVDPTTVVAVKGDCVDFPVAGLTVQQCTKLTVTIPKAGLPDGTPLVRVTNPDPAGCFDEKPGLLRMVPPPTVGTVVPSLVCLDDGQRVVEIDGTDFLTVDGKVPTVAFDGAAVAPAAVVADGCADLTVNHLTVQKCTKLMVTIAKNGLATGTPVVRVTNPETAGCSNEKPGLLTVTPGPKITSAAPPLICAEGVDRAVVLTGTGFLQVGALLPKVTLDGAAVTTVALSGCSPVIANGLTVQSCTTANVLVAKGAYTAGHRQLALENPAPAGCVATTTTALTIPPPLAFAATPQNFCANTGTHQVTVNGTGFLQVGSASFTVAVGGAAPGAPTSPAGCSDLGVDGLAVQSCTSFAISVNTNTGPVGGVQIDVANPAPSSCTLSSTSAVQIVAPPSITTVAPAEICADQTKTVRITGANFANGATVTATPTGSATGSVLATTVAFTSATQIDATFTPGLPAGTYDLTVANAASCSSTKIAALLVDPTPLVFYVDPPVLYSGISVQATLFTSGLTATAKKVQLVNDATGAVTDATAFKSPQRPNKILADIPAGLAAGKYTVRVISQVDCAGELPGAVTVTDTLSLTLDAATPIAPAYVSSTAATAVTLKGTGFTDTPRVYLNPVTTGGTTTATALRAVVFTSGTQLTAAVPAGVPAGDYDLIVVNPGGQVGLAAAAVHVTVKEPPVITAVTPNSFSNGSNQPATIQGLNFDTAGVTVSLACKLGAGATTTSQATGVTGLTATSVGVTLPTAAIPGGSVCLVTLTNTAGGAFFTYSAISVKNPSANLAPWASSASGMIEARRALGFVAGRPTNTSRFLYAIGGDTGTAAGAKTSVEAVPTDVFGNLGAWALQRNNLPAKRTLAGSARIGRFAYLVGGHDGTSATNTTLRSQVLDPLASPDITDLDAALGNGTTGLDQGLWYYRVAATFPGTDASNPLGESLSSEPFPVQLPSNPKKITLALTWSKVAGATGYRLYRTPAAGAGAAAVELLTTTSTCGATTCTFTDTGAATTAGQTPLPTGSLGVWHQPATSTLGTAREGVATIAVPNPANASEWFLYAFGGRNATGTYLSSYEWARVTVAGDGSQTMGGWTAGARNIGTAKADAAAWVVTSSDSSIVAAGQAFVFVGTGHTSANASTGEVTSGTLSIAGNTGDLAATAGGTLDTETGPSGQGLGAAGFGAASGTVYTFGGDKGAGALVSTDSSSAVGTGPSLATWNSLGGGSLTVQRAFCRTAQESAFFYTAGGTNGTTPLNSIEQTVQ
jgi:hypothetical protein